MKKALAAKRHRYRDVEKYGKENKMPGLEILMAIVNGNIQHKQFRKCFHEMNPYSNETFKCFPMFGQF